LSPHRQPYSSLLKVLSHRIRHCNTVRGALATSRGAAVQMANSSLKAATAAPYRAVPRRIRCEKYLYSATHSKSPASDTRIWCCLWPWLGPPPTPLRYVMHFRFCGWCHVFT